MPTSETANDEMNAKYFHSGWEAALREVIATAEHQGPGAAVQWAKDHSARTETPEV